MRLTLTMELDNAAFHEGTWGDEQFSRSEVDRCLRRVAEQVIFAEEGESGRIIDINGNTVGKWEVTDS